jgi:hypothetical protein
MSSQKKQNKGNHWHSKTDGIRRFSAGDEIDIKDSTDTYDSK